MSLSLSSSRHSPELVPDAMDKLLDCRCNESGLRFSEERPGETGAGILEESRRSLLAELVLAGGGGRGVVGVSWSGSLLLLSLSTGWVDKIGDDALSGRAASLSMFSLFSDTSASLNTAAESTKSLLWFRSEVAAVKSLALSVSWLWSPE